MNMCIIMKVNMVPFTTFIMKLKSIQEKMVTFANFLFEKQMKQKVRKVHSWQVTEPDKEWKNSIYQRKKGKKSN